VADSLEADWNDKLRLLAEAQQLCEQQRAQDRKLIDEEQRAAILSLTTNFPQRWRDSSTPDRERKRMVRLLLEDVTLIRTDHLTLHIRFNLTRHSRNQTGPESKSWSFSQSASKAPWILLADDTSKNILPERSKNL
jgi:hypothetical protein